MSETSAFSIVPVLLVGAIVTFVAVFVGFAVIVLKKISPESYKALLFWEKAETVKEYKVPPGVEKYKKLKAEGAEIDKLTLALKLRALETVPLMMQIEKDSKSLPRLQQLGMVSKDVWDGFKSAKDFSEEEFEAVRMEAETLKAGWSDSIWREAASTFHQSAQRQQQENMMSTPNSQVDANPVIDESGKQQQPRVVEVTDDDADNSSSSSSSNKQTTITINNNLKVDANMPTSKSKTTSPSSPSKPMAAPTPRPPPGQVELRLPEELKLELDGCSIEERDKRINNLVGHHFYFIIQQQQLFEQQKTGKTIDPPMKPVPRPPGGLAVKLTDEMRYQLSKLPEMDQKKAVSGLIMGHAQYFFYQQQQMAKQMASQNQSKAATHASKNEELEAAAIKLVQNSGTDMSYID